MLGTVGLGNKRYHLQLASCFYLIPHALGGYLPGKPWHTVLPQLCFPKCPGPGLTKEAAEFEVQLLILRASCFPCPKLSSRNAKSTKKDPFLWGVQVQVFPSPGPLFFLDHMVIIAVAGLFLNHGWDVALDAPYCTAKFLLSHFCFLSGFHLKVYLALSVYMKQKESRKLYTSQKSFTESGLFFLEDMLFVHSIEFDSFHSN